MYDLLDQHEKALACYKQGIGLAPPASSTACSGSRFLKSPTAELK
jgi:hypothetical protein